MISYQYNIIGIYIKVVKPPGLLAFQIKRVSFSRDMMMLMYILVNKEKIMYQDEKNCVDASCIPR